MSARSRMWTSTFDSIRLGNAIAPAFLPVIRLYATAKNSKEVNRLVALCNRAMAGFCSEDEWCDVMALLGAIPLSSPHLPAARELQLRIAHRFGYVEEIRATWAH